MIKLSNENSDEFRKRILNQLKESHEKGVKFIESIKKPKEPNKQFFYCLVCREKIPMINIVGRCPNCDSAGFKTLRMWYGKCHDCSNHFFKDNVLKCNIHTHVPKSICKDYKQEVD